MRDESVYTNTNKPNEIQYDTSVCDEWFIWSQVYNWLSTTDLLLL